MENKYIFKHKEKEIKVFLPKLEIDKETMKQIKNIADTTVLTNMRFYILEFYGEEKAYFRVRRVIHWFIKGAPNASRLRNRASFVTNYAEFENLVREFEETEVIV